MEVLGDRSLLDGLNVPGAAPASWLKLAHDPSYVDQVIACSVPVRIEKEIGFAVGERVSRRAQLAAGERFWLPGWHWSTA